MKKILCLLCCAVMLLCSCGQVPPAAEQPKLTAGECVLREGVWENELLRLEIVNETLTAPLENLNFDFYNDSDYVALVRYQGLLVEQHCDGTWQEVPSPNLIREELVEPFCLASHKGAVGYSLTFTVGGGSYHATYPPLEAGSYRLRIPCYQPDVVREGISMEMVAYFIVENP